MTARKAMIIGLDCAEPSLVLERWRDSLPTLSALMERGTYGRLTSVIPPITVPAWSCMMASRTPGDLGLRLSQPRRPHVRRGVHRGRERDQGASALGPRRSRGRLLDRGRRPRHVSTTAAQGRDGLIARPLRHAHDETVVLVVSDHGAKRLDGGIRVNEWLRREGLLATVAEPNGVTSPRELGIDWPRTVAWGEGGYYARIFLNVRGREPDGVVAPEDYESVRDDLARRLEAIPDADGKPIATRVYKPEEVYASVEGVAPDLIAIFGDLLWRSVGTIGGDEGVHTFENDTGPDDANHAQDGLYILAGPGVAATGPRDAHLLDIAPTLLDLLGIEVPDRMRGGSLVAR